MRAVLQRVLNASITVDGNTVASIGKGLCVLCGFTHGDTEEDLRRMIQKIIALRIFEDDGGVMNLSLHDINGELLVIPQFTLFGDARKGRRPSFSSAMEPSLAKKTFSLFMEMCKDEHPCTRAGIFGAHMQVELINDGPVTILLDSSRLF
ncbi:MAG: D-aminoacyl-tRNA deacylase [Spirochaetota bacterium]